MNDQPQEIKKPEVYTQDPYNPFSYNFVSLQKSKVNSLPIPSTTQIVADPVYNMVGKAFGIKDPHLWNDYADKIFTITEWAKERTGLKDTEQLISWIRKASKYAFVLGGKRIDNIFNKIRAMEVQHE